LLLVRAKDVYLLPLADVASVGAAQVVAEEGQGERMPLELLDCGLQIL
jgi:hypothetical protein